MDARRRVGTAAKSGALISLGACALVGLALWGARDLLIPLTLAFLLSFVAGRALSLLEHRGVHHSIAVTLLSLTLIGCVGLGTWALGAQFAYLSRNLPAYSQNLQQKMDSVELRFRGLVKQFHRGSQSHSPPLSLKAPAAPQLPASLSSGVQDFAPPLLHYLGLSLFVLVLALFMSVYRDDLRDRIIRLAGERNVNLTSEMLEEAASKVSAYLWTQLAVNALFGLLTGTGFFFIGLQFAFFWGTVLGLLRFIPYIGIFIGGALPVLFALATSTAWSTGGLALLLIVAADLLLSQFVEPHVVGRKIGLSPVAVLVSVFVWAFLWGPAGLLLAVPLTACLVVAGRYVPQLEFLRTLLSDEPALTPALQLYHRALSGRDFGTDSWLASHTGHVDARDFVTDTVIPALSRVVRDRGRAVITRKRAHQVCDAILSALNFVQHKLPSVTNEPGAFRVLLAPVSIEPEAVMGSALALLGEQTGANWQVTTRPLNPRRLAALVRARRPAALVLCMANHDRDRALSFISVLAKYAPAVPVFLYRPNADAAERASYLEKDKITAAATPLELITRIGEVAAASLLARTAPAPAHASAAA